MDRQHEARRETFARFGAWVWRLAPVVTVPLLWPLVPRWAYDDPFITYRYAANLRDGLGFVYNPGERVLSTTTPFYTLALALLGGVWSDLPTLSNVLGVAALLIGASVFVELVPRDAPGPVRATGAVFLALTLLPLTTLGSEMPVYTLAILATLALHQRGHPGAAGLVSGVATVTRADGVLVLVVMLVHLIAERQWRRAKRAVVGFGLAAVP